MCFIVFMIADKIAFHKVRANVSGYLQKPQESQEELPPLFATSARKPPGATS